MTFQLEALYAQEGDCLLLHHGTADDPRHVLIDGGVAATFAESLRPRLDQLRKERALGEGESLPIELLVVTHIDRDHLDGIVKLAEHLEELREDRPWDIAGLWYNSFDGVVGDDRSAKVAGFSSSGPPAVRAFVASVAEGQRMRALAGKLCISVNQPGAQFPDGLVMRPSAGPETVDFDDLKLTVLSPDAVALAALERDWDAYLAANPPGKAQGGAAAVGQDRTVPNLSSIVLLAEAEGHRILLTGDANTDEILAGLAAAGLLAGGAPCEVDVLKIPHHGSIRNSKKALYQQVRARHYVISANGENGNPDRETLDLLWDARGSEGGWDLYLTFRRNEFELVEGTGAKAEKRRQALKEIQAWLNKHDVKVIYREPDALGVAIDLSRDGA